MVLQRQLAVRALDLLFACAALYAQNFVVVSLGFRWQGRGPRYNWNLCSGVSGDAHHRRTQQAIF
jgi:hypothetical protein